MSTLCNCHGVIFLDCPNHGRRVVNVAYEDGSTATTVEELISNWRACTEYINNPIIRSTFLQCADDLERITKLQRRTASETGNK